MLTRAIPPTTARPRLAWGLVVSLLCLIPASSGHAQVLYGSLTGNVTDQSGAVIRGAKVEVLNVGTKSAKETTTNDNGVYQFNDLQPGVYRVTISVDSFRTQVQEATSIEANTVRRFDASLEPGGLRETLSVVAQAEALQTDRGDVSVNLTARQVNNLPLAGSVGRNYQSLMQIVPGATLAGEQNSTAGSPQRSISFNVNGVSRLQNNTKLDGASIQYPWLPTNTAYVPPAEAIQAVNIVTNAFDAEQGIAGGAAVNVIIKSGTNDVRGAGWVYDTDSKFRARNFFQTQQQNPKDTSAQFGFAVGGPIVRNKLFFFIDLERTTRRQDSPVRFLTLATAALRNGDFSGTGTTIYDPASNPNPALRTPFPNNRIPANRIDLAAVEMINRLPATNLPGFTDNFTAAGVAEYNRTNVDVKVNYSATSRFSLFGRYSYSPHLIIDPPALGEAGGDALTAGAGGQQGEAPGS
ncbi:MAG: carboxypeptidase regulatory-like domain-containing protein, partial [Vicinamibacterales bacterium]